VQRAARATFGRRKPALASAESCVMHVIGRAPASPTL
jgi:hypothetical protein